MNNVYLVGFMGTGKTAVGKALARRLKLEFVDLDEAIERGQGDKIKVVDIFATKGEDYFRNLESQALREVAEKEACVSACGGGIVIRDDNIKEMQSSGTVICLEANPEVIWQRVKNHTHRPLLNVTDPKAEIKELLDKRAPFYAKIKHHIDTSNLSVEEAVDRIIAIRAQEHRE